MKEYYINDKDAIILFKQINDIVGWYIMKRKYKSIMWE